MNILPRIKFCGVLTVLCSEIRHCAKRQTVSGYVRTTVHHDTLWRTDNLTLLKTGTLKTDQSKHKFKIKKQWQIFIASIAEQSLPAYQV
jgi:hypothetical protein